LLEDGNLNVRASALAALGLTKAPAALPTLRTYLRDPNFRLQKAAAEALADLASADSIASLVAVVRTDDPAISIPTRVAALHALYNIARSNQTTKADQEKAIASILETVQREADEAILGIRAYNLLGDLQARQALGPLQQRLRQEEASQHAWRSQRDALEDKDATEEEARRGQNALQKARVRLHLALELAYNIARIDQKIGVQLLSHDLADVRRGAWLGLGRVGGVELIGQLRQARRQKSAAPFFPHAAYQAIDHILLRLEAQEVEVQELRKLEALYPGEVGTLCQLVSEPGEKGICLRVEWTLAQLQAKGAIHGQYPAQYSAIQNP
jgi:HEAT repeat protein